MHSPSIKAAKPRIQKFQKGRLKVSCNFVLTSWVCALQFRPSLQDGIFLPVIYLSFSSCTQNNFFYFIQYVTSDILLNSCYPNPPQNRDLSIFSMAVLLCSVSEYLDASQMEWINFPSTQTKWHFISSLQGPGDEDQKVTP